MAGIYRDSAENAFIPSTRSGRDFAIIALKNKRDWSMRTATATCIGLAALTAISAQAAPPAPAKAVPTEFTASPPVELAANGCGYPLARRVGSLALGPLCSEDVGKSIAPAIYAIG